MEMLFSAMRDNYGCILFFILCRFLAAVGLLCAGIGRDGKVVGMGNCRYSY